MTQFARRVGQPASQPSNALGTRGKMLLPPPSLLPFPPLPSPSSDVCDEILSTPEANDAWKQYQKFKREELKQVAYMYCRLAKVTVNY